MILDKSEEEWGKFLRTGIGVYVFVLVLAMFPFSDDPTGDIKTLITSWGSFVLAAMWLIGTWRNRQPVRRPPLFFAILLLFLALNLVACLFSSFVGNSFVEFRKLWWLFLLYFLAAQAYRKPEHVRNLMMVICVAVALSSAYAYCQHAGWDPFPWGDRTSDEYRNLPGTFGNPNYAAHTLILAIVMLFFIASKVHLAWCAALALVFLVHLRYTQQRAGIIALVAAVVLLIAAGLIFVRLRRPVASVVTTLVVVAVLGVIGAGVTMAATKVRTGSSYPLDLSLLVRYKSYCSAARMACERPFLGWGPGSYRLEYPQFWTPYEQRWYAQERRVNAHVHNDLIEAAIDAGLFAAGLYLAFLVLGMSFSLLAGFTRADPLCRRLAFTLAAIFCAFLVDGLFGFNVRVPVSAAIIFLMAGALEGIWMPARPRDTLRSLPPLSRAWRGGVVAVGLLFVVLDTGVFASQCLLHSGTGSLMHRDYDKAESRLRWGERLAPWNWFFARQRGLAALSQNDWARANDHLERSLTKNPYQVMTLVPLAQSKMSLGLSMLAPEEPDIPAARQALDEAAGFAERALELCPAFALAEDLLGRISAGRAMLLSKASRADEDQPEIDEAWREADGHFARAVQCGAPNTSELHRQMSQVRIALGDMDGAEEALVRAIQADPSEDANWPFFAGFARETGRYDRLRSTLKWQIERLGEKRRPNRAALSAAYLWLANVEKDGYSDLEAAETAFRNAVHHRPLDPHVWSSYAYFAETDKRLKSFKAFLRETNARLLDEGKRPLPHVAAVALVMNRGPEALVEATASLVAVVQKGGHRGIRSADLGMEWALKLLLNQTRKAELTAENTGLALLHLGIAYNAIQTWDTAEQIFAEAVAKLPTQYQGVCAQHWSIALVHQERANEALDIIQDAASRSPDDLELQHALGRTLVEAGRPKNAQRIYRGLLKSPGLSGEKRERIRGELESLVEQ